MQFFTIVFGALVSYLCLIKDVDAAAVISGTDDQCSPKPRIKCELHSKFESFGIDMSGKSILNVDVSECVAVELNTSASCVEDGQCLPPCVPKSYNVEIHHNKNGPFDVPVVRSCRMMKEHCSNQCQRISKIKYFFLNSKYQQRVDVGACAGQCNDDENGCLPTQTVSKSISGPNGDINVDVIEECNCQLKKCRKADFFVSQWTHTRCGNDTIRKEKVINVGQCVGACKGMFTEPKCIPSLSICSLYIAPRQKSCAPTVLAKETYVDSNFETQSVSTISECGCK